MVTLSAIQSEEQWWNEVDHVHGLIAGYDRGEESLSSVWEGGISPLAWPDPATDAPWRQRPADESHQLSDDSFLLDGTDALDADGSLIPRPTMPL